MLPTAYSYRQDSNVPAFDDGAALIIFDGVCVLCSAGVQWMLQHDPSGTSRFAAIQQPIPQALYRHYGLDTEKFDTFMVLKDGLPATKWAGVLAAGQLLPPPWRWLSLLGRAIPGVIGDGVYDWVQRNRFKWFGGRQTCLPPPSAHEARFL